MTQGMHVRIDNRLLHGQVVQFWIPHLEVQRLVIADDATAADQTLVSLYRMVMPRSVTLDIVVPEDLCTAVASNSTGSTLVLLGSIEDATRARRSGFAFERLTIGNVHAGRGRERVTDSVFLSAEEIQSLLMLRQSGTIIDIQSFPGEQFKLELDDCGGPVWVKK
jgi:mannose/fructose/N-acetylgalactosamine-specific phosphotransferase system component IIB